MRRFITVLFIVDSGPGRFANAVGISVLGATWTRGAGWEGAGRGFAGDEPGLPAFEPCFLALEDPDEAWVPAGDSFVAVGVVTVSHRLGSLDPDGHLLVGAGTDSHRFGSLDAVGHLLCVGVVVGVVAAGGVVTVSQRLGSLDAEGHFVEVMVVRVVAMGVVWAEVGVV